ncbi:hypothetical protein [Kitasatospora cheerisanensis]|uniref:Putative two-component system sensor kinase n=1 Tax=Kitasatospora cheerisanensis KCTC 2395 TaxID=1348663 RepID=A0A066YR24_9ACTN|nr:putative two-component system sensor kinase [Kitasatospora cheerisanensis KCTC 2395]
MLTAAAVAVAIAVVAVSCWLLVRNTLYGQVRESLKNADPPGAPNQFRVACDTSAASALAAVVAQTDGRQPFHQNKYDNQFISASGMVCFPLQSTRAIQYTQDDLTASTNNRPVYRSGEYADGTPAMVRIWSTPATINGEHVVLLTAVSTREVQDSLNSLALLITGVAGLGVIGAGSPGGWWPGPRSSRWTS